MDGFNKDGRKHQIFEHQAANVFTSEKKPASAAGGGLGNQNGHGGYWGIVMGSAGNAGRFSSHDDRENGREEALICAQDDENGDGGQMRDWVLHRPTPIRATSSLLPQIADHVDPEARRIAGFTFGSFPDHSTKEDTLSPDNIRQRTSNQGNYSIFNEESDSALMRLATVAHARANEAQADTPASPDRSLSPHQVDAPVHAQPLIRSANLQPAGASHGPGRRPCPSTILHDREATHRVPAMRPIAHNQNPRVPCDDDLPHLTSRQQQLMREGESLPPTLLHQYGVSIDAGSPLALEHDPSSLRQERYLSPCEQIPTPMTESILKCDWCEKRRIACRPRTGKSEGACETCYRKHIACSLSKKFPGNQAAVDDVGTSRPAGVDIRKRIRNRNHTVDPITAGGPVGQTLDDEDSERSNECEDQRTIKRMRMLTARSTTASSSQSDTAQSRPRIVPTLAGTKVPARTLHERVEVLERSVRELREEVEVLERVVQELMSRLEKKRKEGK